MIRRFFLALAGVAIAALAGVGSGEAQQLDYSGSLQYASGDYVFTKRTSALYLYSGLGMTAGRVRLSASLPLILQSTPWLVFTDASQIPRGDGDGSGQAAGADETGLSEVDTTSYEQFGFGDPLLHAGLRLLSGEGAWPAVQVTLSVKIPLADVERGFSTGEWDYAAGLSLMQSLGTTFLFADLAYWYLGDMAGVPLENSLAYGVGLGRSLRGGKFGLLASLLGNTAVQEGTTGPLQASLGLSYLLGVRKSVMASVSFGLTESAPDVSASLGWLFRF